MKEKCKTFLLLFLVCISVYLTSRLWIKSPNETLAPFKKDEAELSNYLFTDIIKPHKYLLNFDKKKHTVFYNDENNNLWSSVTPVLKDVLSSKDINSEVLSNKKYSTYNDKKSIVYFFPEKFNTYIMARSFGVEEPNNIIEKIPKINKIYFYFGNGDPFFVFSNGKEHLKIYDDSISKGIIRHNVKTIEQEKQYTYYYPIKDTVGGDSDIFIPYEMSKNLPSVYVENELDIKDIKGIRNIAGKFFNRDIDYIREIVEDDGSIIYIYKQRVLKFNETGLLEYFDPLEEEIKERNLYTSLNTTAEFLSSHIGVPKDMYLAKVEKIETEGNFGYRLIFRYRIKGIPVILGNDIAEDFIQIDVFNKHVENYKRFIRKKVDKDEYDEVDNKKMLSAFDVINMNYDLLEKDYIEDKNINIVDVDKTTLMDRVLSSIENMDIAYLDNCLHRTEEKLIGIWLLELGHKTYAFDIYSGELILERN